MDEKYVDKHESSSGLKGTLHPPSEQTSANSIGLVRIIFFCLMIFGRAEIMMLSGPKKSYRGGTHGSE